MRTKYYLGHSVVLTKGAKRSLLLDLQRLKTFLLPTECCERILSNDKMIDGDYEYIEYLLKDGFIKETKVVDVMTLLGVVNHLYLIIDYSDNLDYEKLKVDNSFFVQIRLFEITDFDLFLSFLHKYMHNARFVEVIVDGTRNEYMNQNFIDLLCLNRNLHSIKVYGKRKGEIALNGTVVRFKNEEIHGKESCGRVAKDMFLLSDEMVQVSKNYNSCLFRKISIDQHGFIKNCPSMTDTFGSISQISLQEVLKFKDFRKYWNVNKEQISICKDCEFRYICTDCRAYVEQPLDQSGSDGTNLSKPLKCGYDPYTGEWSDWKNDSDKMAAIELYKILI